MAGTNDIQVGLWGNDDFLALSQHARAFYVWSFTNAECNMAGVYRLSVASAAFQTGLTRDEVLEAVQELHTARFVLTADGWIWVRSRVHHLRTQTVQMAKSIVATVRSLTTGHPLGAAFFAEYSDAEWGRGQARGVLASMLIEAAEEREDWLSTVDLQPSPRVVDPLQPSTTVAVPRRGTEAVAEAAVKQQQTRARVQRAPVDPDALPDGFDDRLVPVLDNTVLPALRRVAVAHGAQEVTRAAAARVMHSFPKKDHPATVGDFEHYWVHGRGAGQRRTDVVATYRNLAIKQPDRAGHLRAVTGPARPNGDLSYLNDREMA